MQNDRPLAGLTVVEFTHVVMGPAVGRVLADLGASILRIEPPGGDPTRRMQGFGKGFFTFYNHGKASRTIDLKDEAGLKEVQQVLAKADILVENYGPGVLDRLGLGYEDVKKINPALIYCSLKGFLAGPYESRIAVDEIVQMMGGLAYMTGAPGQPTRAGTSALDLTGGLFGVIGILAAVHERTRTGLGKCVKASLFESSAFLMGQFMAGLPAPEDSIKPMPARTQIWAIYQLFKTADAEEVFIGVISDKHWVSLCLAFAWHDLLKDEQWLTGTGRLTGQKALVPEVERRIGQLPFEEVISSCLRENVPHAVVNDPAALRYDEHLVAGNHLVEVIDQKERTVRIPKTPLRFS